MKSMNSLLMMSVTFLMLTRAPAAIAQGATLGDKVTYPALNFAYAVSPDKKAFTLIFDDLVAAVNSCKTKPAPSQLGPIHPTTPVVSRTSTIVIPVTGGNPLKMSLFVRGYAATTIGAHATLLLNVNGKPTVINFSPNTDREFTETIEISAPYVAEIRLTAVLLAECDGTHLGSEAYISVDTIDSDLTLAKQRPIRKPLKR